MTGTTVKTNNKASLGILAVLLVVTFVVPAFVPPPLANSDSYCFGFNNHLFQALFLITILCAAGLTLSGRLALPQTAALPPATDDLTRPLIVKGLAVAAVLCGFMCWATAPLGGINDSVYYLDRIHLMLRGLVPVRDFEFIYGTGPLYGSLFLARCLHISANAAYFSIWTISSLLGIFLLWLAIRWFDLPPTTASITWTAFT